MGWGTALRALGRRWYLVVIGAAATVALGFLTVDLTPPTYVVRGTELLLPPAAQVEQGTRNPLLELSGLEAPAALVIGQLDGQEARASVAELSPTAEYTVESDPAMRGPTVLVTLSDTSAESALETLDAVLDHAAVILADMQTDAEVPENAKVTSMRLVSDAKPEVETSATLRTGVMLVGAGIAVTVVLTVLLDGWLRRRTDRAVRRTVDRGSANSFALHVASPRPARADGAELASDEPPRPLARR